MYDVVVGLSTEISVGKSETDLHTEVSCQITGIYLVSLSLNKNKDIVYEQTKKGNEREKHHLYPRFVNKGGGEGGGQCG